VEVEREGRGKEGKGRWQTGQSDLRDSKEEREEKRRERRRARERTGTRQPNTQSHTHTHTHTRTQRSPASSLSCCPLLLPFLLSLLSLFLRSNKARPHGKRVLGSPIRVHALPLRRRCGHFDFLVPFLSSPSFFKVIANIPPPTTRSPTANGCRKAWVADDSAPGLARELNSSNVAKGGGKGSVSLRQRLSALWFQVPRKKVCSWATSCTSR